MPVGVLAQTMRNSSSPNNLGAWRPGTGKNVIALEQCEWKRVGFSEGRKIREKDIDRMEAKIRQDPDFQELSKEEQNRRLVDALNELVDQIENKGIHEADAREKRINDFYQANGMGARENSPGAFLKWLTAPQKPVVPFGYDALSFIIPDKEPTYSEWYEEVMGLIFDLDEILHHAPEEYQPAGQIRHIPCLHKDKAWTAFGMDGRRREAPTSNESKNTDNHPRRMTQEDEASQSRLSSDISQIDLSKQIRAMILALRKNGFDDKAITKKLDKHFPGISDTNLGGLLPADPSQEISKSGKRTRGQRLRNKRK